mmetsp:Transcript_52170/g.132502  ORF Transcript_52170/g.132502 Transcript_52170/m.132502 type:complete len:84 (+) Transcript_52170:593-844(+)
MVCGCFVAYILFCCVCMNGVPAAYRPAVEARFQRWEDLGYLPKLSDLQGGGSGRPASAEAAAEEGQGQRDPLPEVLGILKTSV